MVFSSRIPFTLQIAHALALNGPGVPGGLRHPKLLTLVLAQARPAGPPDYKCTQTNLRAAE
ncbi:hypothetical protein BgiBS90_015988, partial [Biomphalaria glabrata]